MSTTPAMGQTVKHVERAVDDTLSRKMARRGTVLHQPSTVEDVEARLRAFLDSRLDGPFAIRDLARLAGGASKEQFVFHLDWTRDGSRVSDKMVLRLDPPASMVESPRMREFEILRALEGTIPVPHTFWATEDPDLLGGPALICGFVDGTASPAEGAKTASGLGTTYGSRLQPLLADQFVTHLANLHKFDWHDADLGSMEHPRAGTTEAIDWRLASTDRAWQEDAFEVHPVISLTQEWLWARRPVVDHVSIVHGDYRNGNFLFDEESGQITAILDWEVTYLGDRHHDLAYAMMDGWGYRDAETGTFYCSALVPREQFIEDYQEKSGMPVDRERLDYYTVVNLYWASVALTGTGPRNSFEKMTHLDTMQVFLGGLGAFFLDKLLAIVGTD